MKYNCSLICIDNKIAEFLKEASDKTTSKVSRKPKK